MNELDPKREAFFLDLHEMFLLKNGLGAFASISVSEAIELYEQYLESGENDDVFIRRYVKSVSGQ